MGAVYLVPGANLTVEFKRSADLVIITNEDNGTLVEMTTDDWGALVERAKVARALAT